MKIKNLNKIGFVFLILVFSLSCISISYSVWTDHIDMLGSISTWEDSGSIGDYVWNDLNRDGVQDTDEIGISNIVINLYNSYGDILDSTLTDQDGHYAFYQLSPGEYYVEFVKPEGYLFSSQDIGLNDNLDSDANPLNGKTIVTLISPNDKDGRWDAGIYSVD